jgi:hypothetical protein
MLQEKTEQIVEMAGVMSKSIQIDDDYSAKEQEIRSRLVTENKVGIQCFSLGFLKKHFVMELNNLTLSF